MKSSINSTIKTPKYKIQTIQLIFKNLEINKLKKNILIILIYFTKISFQMYKKI